MHTAHRRKGISSIPEYLQLKYDALTSYHGRKLSQTVIRTGIFKMKKQPGLEVFLRQIPYLLRVREN